MRFITVGYNGYEVKVVEVVTNYRLPTKRSEKVHHRVRVLINSKKIAGFLIYLTV